MQTHETHRALADAALTGEALREAVLSSPLPVAVFAEDGRFLILSRAWCELSGYGPEQIPSIDEWTERAFGSRRDEVRAWIDELFTLNRRLDEGEFIVRAASGEQRVWELSSSPIGRLPDGRRAIMAIARDVTAPSGALRELRHERATAQETLRAARAGMWEWDLAANRLTFSESSQAILGRLEGPLTIEQWLSRLDGAQRQVWDSAVMGLIDGGSPHLDIAVQVRGPEGTRRRVRLLGGCTQRDQGEPVRLAGLILDAPQAPTAASEAAAPRAPQRWKMELEDRDRRRIADELHRSLGQQLAGLAMVGKALHNKLEADGSAHGDEADYLVRHLLSAHRHARRLARGLSPVGPEPDGLAAALAELARRCSDLHRVGCTFSSETPVKVADPFVASHLYHIAQEAVHNAVRHGRPRRILITLAQSGHELLLEIRDDGRGMPAPGSAGSTGYSSSAAAQGIKLMHHRAQAIGATLDIAPGPAGGVIVSCRAPAPPAAP